MAGESRLDRGRRAFRRRAWSEARAELTAADEESPLDVADLERLAIADYLLGRHREWEEIWARAHREALGRSEPRLAARCAFWLGFALASRGEHAPAGGWFARARRTLDEGGPPCEECVERGYLLLPEALRQIGGGDEAKALETYRRATTIGERYTDPDLATYARHGQGRALIRMGEMEAGVALLDETMVSVMADETSPMVAGDVYCSVIEACQETFDLRRAREWTAALTRWCEEQPDLMAYRGQCLTRRSEILRLHGEWPDALDEARRAGEQLSRPPGQSAAGAAFYQQGEIHRLRGRFAQAEEAYRQASEWGRDPQPGLALLRLAQGDVDAAAAAMRRVVDEARSRRTRSRVLGAHVEVMLATGDVEAAREAADELSGLAESLDAPLLRAAAAFALGSVALEDGESPTALRELRKAWETWRELDVPHESARAQVLA
ncbi:MAG: DNA-binding response regulator, partial [Gemmatimonadota bacterium]